MKMLHCSDILVGLPFPHLALRADHLRNQRLDTLKSLLVRAKREKVEFILLAGNTLADNRLLRRELKEIGAILMSSPVPVYLLPGRTDPFTADSPYRLNAELFGAPIQILSEAVPIPLPGGTLFPCPIRKRDSVSATDWIPPRHEEEGMRIGLACYPGELEAKPDLDYLALGGRRMNQTAGTHCWSGTPEATDYAEERGYAQLVTLTSGAPPTIQTLRIGRLHWQAWQRQARHAEKLQDELESIKDPVNVLLRLTLTGQLGLEPLENLLEVLANFRPKLFHLEIDNRIILAPRQDELYHHPLLRSMSRNLAVGTNQTDQAGPDDVAGDADVARAAILDFSAMIRASQQEDLI